MNLLMMPRSIHTLIRFQPHRLTQPHGFSVVELLIVVTIIAIAAALVVPMMRDNDTAQLRAAAGLLVADLAFAQVESIAHADALRCLVLDADNKTYSVATVSQPTVPLTNPADKSPYSVTFGQRRAQTLGRVTFFSNNIGVDKRLGFGAYGQLDQTTAATFTLAAGDRKITITLDPITGQPTVGSIQ